VAQKYPSHWANSGQVSHFWVIYPPHIAGWHMARYLRHSMTRMSIILYPYIGGAKEPSSQPNRSEPKRKKNHGQIFTSVRRGFAFLFMMAVLTYAYSNREELQNWVNSKVTRLMAPGNTSGMIRQSALNHEKEVNQVAQ
jgi:hypothetical protein